MLTDISIVSMMVLSWLPFRLCPDDLRSVIEDDLLRSLAPCVCGTVDPLMVESGAEHGERARSNLAVCSQLLNIARPFKREGTDLKSDLRELMALCRSKWRKSCSRSKRHAGSFVRSDLEIWALVESSSIHSRTPVSDLRMRRISDIRRFH